MPQDQREQQRERMREAVDRKAEESRAAAEQESIVSPARQQDQSSPRAKNSGHGKKTADKWNQ
jgi:hypothetical protein